MGKDFNLTLAQDWNPPTVLAVGKNQVRRSELEVDFQYLSWNEWNEYQNTTTGNDVYSGKNGQGSDVR